jgi:hypothetical protein
MIVGEWPRRLWYRLNRRRMERELEDEMAAHRAMMADPLRSAMRGSCARRRVTRGAGDGATSRRRSFATVSAWLRRFHC